MNTMNNGHADQVAQLITELRSKKTAVEAQIQAAEALLDTMTISGQGGSYFHPNVTPAQQYKLPVRDAILAYARSLADGVYRVKDAADAFVASGMYQKKGVAAAGMYWHLKSDNRFTKIGPGTFRFREVR